MHDAEIIQSHQKCQFPQGRVNGPTQRVVMQSSVSIESRIQ